MKPLHWGLFLCIVLIFPGAANAECQEAEKLTNPMSIGIRGHYGFIIPHSEAIAEISESHPWGIETDLAWHLLRERIWKHCYCYPRTGFSLNYFNFNFPEVLGHSLILYPYIEPYIMPHRTFSISFRFGIGPAWISRIYDPESNPDNFFFSSHLSFVAMLNAALNVRLSSRLSTRLAFNYNHISNGGISQPNVGMNFPTVNAGVDYSLTEVRFPCRARDTLHVLYHDRTWWNVYLLATMKDDEQDNNEHHPVIGAGIYYNYLIGRILALNAGTEWISDPAFDPDHHRAAILLGFDLLFGRFSFIHQWGWYYYAPIPARHRVYQRYGLNLRFTERLYTGINIKAHGHVADLLDFRLGIRF